ncbi:MAG: adenosyl-hopene transferase HpnH [Armatimonadota bacterium]|nr:adenosyl-hopene transferase HpnH [bacterium]
MRFPIGLSASLTAYILRKKMAREKFVPLVLMLEPLFACNLNCSTCGRIREYKDHVSEMMSLDDCFGAVQECGAPVVSVCGGEPLIYPHIIELINGLIEMQKYVYLCTNGLRLAEMADKLTSSRKLQLNVHIDGPAEVHDIVVEKAGAYDAAVRGIENAVGRGFKVSVNTTVCKQTDMNQIDELMGTLSRLGVGTFMLSPAYSYEAVGDKECFMNRDDVHEKFKDIDTIAQRHQLADTPIYLEFLKGERELTCTAWGNPTRNAMGWRSPCYLIADKHFDTYNELIDNTNWDSFGAGKDPRCKNCMVHCGFEPTAALMINRQPGDITKMMRWQLG